MNRLGAEPSRYLRQHANQPVSWFPWGAEALERARSEDRPLFVSVGYSACHWCHVMAHESFDDLEVASLLNEDFVPVKVDREERPDIDAVYMEALIATHGSGGWPMSVFATPDGRPFFCGTYFPRHDRSGLPGFDRVLAAITDAWQHRRSAVEAEATRLAEAVARRTAAPLASEERHRAVVAPSTPAAASSTSTPESVDTAEADTAPATPVTTPDPTWAGAAAAAEPARLATPDPDDASIFGSVLGGPGGASGRSRTVLALAAGQLVSRLDPTDGGFGPPPKFPQPTVIELLLQHYRLTGDDHSLRAATTTLASMAAGGIYDHLAGGFARYSTDATWTVPHFEKMLYDQAGLVRAYLHAWQVTGDGRWRQVVEETVDFVLGNLGLPAGGLAAAIDADSEGEEGRYYVWEVDELRNVLGADYPAVASWYQADGPPAFEGRHILRRSSAGPLERPPVVEAGRRRLLHARSCRVAPGRDDKVVTEWNAMFAGALAEASGALERPDWAARVEELGELLWAALRQPGTGRLMRTWQDGQARHDACAADHAWLVDALTRLAELTGSGRWLDRAVEVAEDLLRRFLDASGFLAMTASDAERLVARPVEVLDGATPSASSVAAVALLRLGALADRPDLAARGYRMAGSLGSVAQEHPLAMAQAVVAMTMAESGITDVVVTGSRLDMLRVCRRRYDPPVVLTWGDRHVASLWDDRPDDGRAYVCRQSSCLEPAADPADLADRLDLAVGAYHHPADAAISTSETDR